MTEQLESRLDRLESIVEDQQATIRRQRERNADLEARLDRVEAELGIGGGRPTGGVADD